jgi:hypothetical protein
VLAEDVAPTSEMSCFPQFFSQGFLFVKLKPPMSINLLNAFLPSGGRRISLTQGQFAVVDDEDFDELNQHKWHAQWCLCTESFYAQRSEYKKKRNVILMHRQILGLKSGSKRQSDHVDHNTLDNRRCNLRIVTARGNGANRRDQSQYGVGIRKSYNRYSAKIRHNGKLKHLGYFTTVKEAQAAREIYKNKHKLT